MKKYLFLGAILAALHASCIHAEIPTAPVDPDATRNRTAEASGTRLRKATQEVAFSTEGLIKDITDQGRIILGNGVELRQWAITYTDIDMARQFLVGKIALCREVLRKVHRGQLQGDIGTFDCNVTPFKEFGTPAYAWLSIYAWAEELNFGVRECSLEDQMPEDVISIEHIIGYNYQCHGKVSLKQQSRIDYMSVE